MQLVGAGHPAFGSVCTEITTGGPAKELEKVGDPMLSKRLKYSISAAVILALTVACSSGGAPPESVDAQVPPADSSSTAAASGAVAGSGSAAPSGSDTAGSGQSTSPMGEIKQEDPESAGEPKKGGTLRFLARLDADELDPAVATDSTGILVDALVYEALLSNFRGEIGPGLAESWEISDDSLTYTFTLRDNAFFHGGRQVEAEDVKFSLERVMDPATRSPQAGSYSSIASIETPDATTVVITLSEPFAPMLFMLASLSASVVDKDAIKDGKLTLPDGGTGPFQLAERNIGQNLILKKAPKYWDPELPHLDGIEITFNPDDNARAAALRSHSVDLLWRPAPEFIDSLKQDPNVKWYGGSGSLSLHLLLNSSKKPFDDVRVRQAVYHALDRQELLDVANSGAGVPLNAGYLPPDRWGSLQEPVYPAPDLDKAKALMAEAGYADGFDVDLTVIASSAFQVRQAEVEQKQLAEIGIRITIDPVDPAIARQKTSDGDFDMYQSGFGLRADPDERFTLAFTSAGGLNYAKWQDEEFDSLIEQARVESDRDAREKLYQDADRILAERGPAAFTFLSADYDAVWKNVMGYRGDSTPGFSIYKYLWLDQ